MMAGNRWKVGSIEVVFAGYPDQRKKGVAAGVGQSCA